jgi:hypothetical protein
VTTELPRPFHRLAWSNLGLAVGDDAGADLAEEGEQVDGLGALGDAAVDEAVDVDAGEGDMASAIVPGGRA